MKFSTPAHDAIAEARSAMSKGDMASAFSIIRAALKADPSPLLVLEGADLLTRLGRHREATQLYRAAASNPEGLSLTACAKCLWKSGRKEEAIENLLAAYHADTLQDPLSQMELAWMLLQSGRRSTAENIARIAVNGPDTTAASKAAEILALAELERGDMEGAIRILNKHLTVFPHDSRSRLNRGNLLLLHRDPRGWLDLEYRQATSSSANLAAKGFSKWYGEPDVNLVVVGEEGVGDQIAYSCLLKAAAERARRVTVVTEARVNSLLTSLPGNVNIQAELPQPRHAAKFCYFADLAHVFGFAETPFSSAIIDVDKRTVQQLRDRYTCYTGGKPLIGVSWSSGNPSQGRYRSLAAHDLDALHKANQHFAWLSLQYDTGFTCTPDWMLSDPDIDPIKDLTWHCAQIAACDAVVTIDNTTAHLCGAMATPAHLLLPHSAGLMWYWGTATRTPWYGSLTLHRQFAQDDWTNPIRSVSAALQTTGRR